MDNEEIVRTLSQLRERLASLEHACRTDPPQGMRGSEALMQAGMYRREQIAITLVLAQIGEGH